MAGIWDSDGFKETLSFELPEKGIINGFLDFFIILDKHINTKISFLGRYGD